MFLNRKIILNKVENQTINRIGGSMPIYFLDKSELISGFDFYACFQHPFYDDFVISIFIPSNYNMLSEGKIYPNCAVKVIVHTHSDESQDVEHLCRDLGKMYFTDFIENRTDEGIVQVGGIPQLIQDENYYLENLEKDGYIFLMQIDEALYPDDLVVGSYPFNFGALYLYCKPDNTKDIVAGFWQNS